MAPITTNGKQPGHMLLVAIVLITIFSVMMAMAISPIRTSTQRQKEREMVYRAEHIADGIRRYFLENGRFPFALEELVDGEKRYVRKLYPDPMTESGTWTYVYLTPGDRDAVSGLNSVMSRLVNAEVKEVNSENIDENRPGLRRSTDSVFKIRDQQITGIRSKSDEEGFMVRDDSSIYSDWLFSALPQNQVTLDDFIDKVQTENP